ncbi:MAG: hypothetical protein ACJ798_16185 [Phenylobacterium sp.]
MLHGVVMENASQFRKHARDCRELAERLQEGEARELLHRMAHHWDALADLREDPDFPRRTC